MNKLERMNIKMTKRLKSPISPLKRTHWNDRKRAQGKKPHIFVTSPLLHFISCIHTFFHTLRIMHEIGVEEGLLTY